VNTRLQVGRRLFSRLALPALVFTAAFPASSQVIEYASDSASATCRLEGAVPDEAAILPAPLASASPIFNEDRILGVMPDYQTVRDTTRPVAPLTAKEKWLLAAKQTVDPFNIATAFLTAAESQAGNQTPKYGEGWANYGKRVGAAQLDFGSQNYFSAGVLAILLHQDPRYFRKGPRAKVLPRVFYSIAQLFVCHDDSGREVFNATNLGGTVLGIATSNLYYPAASRRGTVMAGRMWTSLMGGAVGNLMSEFWPDVQQIEQKFLHRKDK
jgi:hypothetical protein